MNSSTVRRDSTVAKGAADRAVARVIPHCAAFWALAVVAIVADGRQGLWKW